MTDTPSPDIATGPEEINPGDRVYVVLRDTYVYARAVGIDEDGYMVIRFDASGEPNTMRYNTAHVRLVSSLPKTFYDGMSKTKSNNRMLKYCDIDGNQIKAGYVVGEVSDHKQNNGRLGIVRHFGRGGELAHVGWNGFRGGFSPCNKLIVVSTNRHAPSENVTKPPESLLLGDAPAMTARPDKFYDAVEFIDNYLNTDGMSEGHIWWRYVIKRLHQVANLSTKPMNETLYKRYRDAAKQFTSIEKNKKGGRMRNFDSVDDNTPRIKDRG